MTDTILTLLDGARIDDLRISAAAAEIVIDLTPAHGAATSLTLSGVSALWISGFDGKPGRTHKVLDAMLFDGPKAGNAEDRDHAIDMLGLDGGGDPFAGGAKILYLEPAEIGELEIAVRCTGLALAGV